MTLLNLSLITRTLLTLLDERLPRYPDWPAGATLTASPAPPDLVTGTHALSLYLYHLKEDAHTKSQDWPIDDAVPLRYRPMGVTLNYVLCPRSNATDVAERTLIDQLLMGLAVKSLHDYPVIDDTTTVETAGLPRLVMPAAMRGRGNRLRILMRPTPVEEASQYWQAGTQAMRLAAYYEVSSTLLEPEEARSRRSRVLTVGVHLSVRGRPRVDTTRNTVSFTLPGEAAPRVIELSPAEVAFGQGFEVVGSDLKGDRTTLLLNHPTFSEPVAVDAAWAVTSDGSVLKATARPAAGAQPIVPGIYGVIVRTTTRATLPDGSRRDFDAESNETPIAIAPGIVNVVFAAGLGTLTVDGFDVTALSGSDLMLFAGSDRLTRAAGAPAPGQFQTSAADTVVFRLPGEIASGAHIPLRLIARSAESAPLWVEAP